LKSWIDQVFFFSNFLVLSKHAKYDKTVKHLETRDELEFGVVVSVLAVAVDLLEVLKAFGIDFA
jgi:hypothetical protein